MKIKILRYLILTLLLSSCTIYMPKRVEKNHVPDRTGKTHSEYMNQFKNKKDVLISFGIADKQEKIEGIEIWYYDKGTTTISNTSGRSSANLKDNPYGDGINANTNNRSTTSTTSSTSYVEFQFEEDNVINYRTKGVNYGNVKKDTLKRKKRWATFHGILIDYAILIVVSTTIMAITAPQ